MKYLCNDNIEIQGYNIGYKKGSFNIIQDNNLCKDFFNYFVI